MGKLQPTNESVEAFIASIENPQIRSDSEELIKIMSRVTKEPPTVWSHNIIGFGTYHYKYESGHEGNAFVTGFSPRKPKLVIYLTLPPEEQRDLDLFKKLGKYKATKACLYVTKLSDIDTTVLEKLLEQSVKTLKERYPAN